ncbi:ferrochelatase [Flavobacteriales bacterium]|jgi:ferrochelatase|nr:ferrochelatase [Flavobacteriales bacterium]
MKTGILLINLGTPDNPRPAAVGRYLTEFLSDGRVIDIPWLPRQILVRGIISPLRRFSSSREYKKVWTEKGSPLLIHGQELTRKVSERITALSHAHPELGELHVHFAMRYQQPSMPKVLEEMRKEGYDRIVVLPLYAQYASATTGSTHQEAMRLISKWYVIPEVRLISQYWDDEGYLSCFEERGRQFDLDAYDHILFSYHGVPTRQVDKVYEDRRCANHSCESEINEENKYCYKATCYATTRALVERLGIPEDRYSVAFQSRLDKKWLTPFSDKVIEERAKAGVKKLLVFSPAFVADCLETTVEIGEEYVEIFEEHGGEHLDLVPSLNAEDDWADAVTHLIQRHL